MIGVAANSADLETAEEFFELFKTAWEPAVPGRRYAVVLSTERRLDGLDADHYFVYSSGGSDETVVGRRGPLEIEWYELKLPILGEIGLCERTSDSVLSFEGRAVDRQRTTQGRDVRWIGYDLFQEVRTLLTKGQPAEFASRPTVDMHIALLRRLLQDAGIAFVEVPPHPYGFDFTCCLTHDVDFFGIRRQGFDRTVAGFAARASLGSIADVARGRRTVGEAAQNIGAVASLPLVFLGVLPDFWQPFESYAEVEDPKISTFFLVPFKGQPGVSPDGTTDSARAVPYGVSEIRAEAAAAAERGSEIALHGIDAWRDRDAGEREKNQVVSVSDSPNGEPIGVRMHWLYFDESSPNTLEGAGFSYDSTCGYNDAVGYRAGTSQVFRLAGTQDLMELPLSIMDSALFSGGRLGLSPDDAMVLCRQIVSTARQTGGTVVVNWHCRSLAPERLWGRFYKALIAEIGAGGKTWFATAGEAVAWFRWRRAIRFRHDSSDSSEVEVLAPPAPGPGGVVRVFSSDARRSNVHEYVIDGSRSIPVRLPTLMRHHV